MKTDEIVVLWEIPLSGDSLDASKEWDNDSVFENVGTKMLNRSF